MSSKEIVLVIKGGPGNRVHDVESGDFGDIELTTGDIICSRCVSDGDHVV